MPITAEVEGSVLTTRVALTKQHDRAAPLEESDKENESAAVNSDESVKRLKGPGRPINPLERRMAVLAALEAVDYVVAFDTDTPEPLLEKIKPDVLVKGGDYTVDQVVGAPIVQAYGGRVEVLDFAENISTTHIVQRIRGE